MRSIGHLILVLSSLMPAIARPDSTEHRSLGTTIERDLAIFLRLTGNGLLAPLHWDATDWRNAGATALGTLTVSTLDHEAYATAHRSRTRTNNRLEQIFEPYGRGITGAAITGTVYGAGILFDDEWLRGTGITMASALTIASTFQLTMKFLIGRARPYTRLGNGTFRPFSTSADFLSLPSGHTVVALTISSVLAFRIKNTYASTALFAAAGITALSRIYSDNHWFSDVALSTALATFVSASVVSSYEREVHSGQATTQPLHIRFGHAELIPLPGRLLIRWPLNG